MYLCVCARARVYMTLQDDIQALKTEDTATKAFNKGKQCKPPKEGLMASFMKPMPEAHA
jgi:hypothetical protein